MSSSNDKNIAKLLKEIEKRDLSILVLLQIEDVSELEQKIENSFISEVISFFSNEYRFKNIYALGDSKFALLGDFDAFIKTNLSIEKHLELLVERVKKSDLSLDITISYSVGKYMLYEDSLAGLKEAIKARKKINFSNDSSTIDRKKIKEKELLDLTGKNKYGLKTYRFFGISKNGSITKVIDFPILDFFKFVFKS